MKKAITEILHELLKLFKLKKEFRRLKKLKKYTIKHREAVDDYCSSPYLTIRTNRGLRNMSKYYNKIEKIKGEKNG